MQLGQGNRPFKLTKQKIYRKTHEAKINYFRLKCVTQTTNVHSIYAKNRLFTLDKYKV